MKLEIPDDDRELLRKWLVEPNEQTEKILSALEKEEPALQRSELAKRVAADVGVSTDSIRDLLIAFFNMSNTVAMLEEGHREHAPQILFNSLALEATDAGARALFEGRVKRILDAKSVEITAKALSVKLDNPNTFCGARTLSEMRPVFAEGGMEPKAAVIVHQLKIAFHTGAERRLSEVFIAMDHEDLHYLRLTLDRAMQKHVKLAEQAKRLDLPLLEES